MTNTDFRTAMQEEFRLTVSDLPNDLLDRYFAQACDYILNEILKSENIGDTPIVDIYTHTTTNADAQMLEPTDKILWIDNTIQYGDGTDIVIIRKGDMAEVILNKDIKLLLSNLPSKFALKDFNSIAVDMVLPASDTITWKGIKETTAIIKIQTVGNFDNVIYEQGKMLVSKFLNLYARG